MTRQDNNPNDTGLSENERDAALSDLSRSEDSYPSQENQTALSPTHGAKHPREQEVPRPISRLDEAEKQIRIVSEWLIESDVVLFEEIIELLKAGLTGEEALDYLAVNVHGYGQTEWGEIRDVAKQTVQKRIYRAEEKLNNA